MAEKPKVHILEEKRSPIRVLLRCSCGWRMEFTRKQNALARASKMKAAANLHLKKSGADNDGIES